MKYSFLLLLLLSTVISAANAESPSYKILFGVIEKDQQTGNPQIKETVIIPLKLKSTGFEFGFEIIPPDNQPYTYQSIVHTPSPPQHIGGIAEKDNPDQHALVGKTPVQNGVGPYMQPTWFDSGDPLGEWKIDVLVNGKLVKTITFTVVAS